MMHSPLVGPLPLCSYPLLLPYLPLRRPRISPTLIISISARHLGMPIILMQGTRNNSSAAHLCSSPTAGLLRLANLGMQRWTTSTASATRMRDSMRRCTGNMVGTDERAMPRDIRVLCSHSNRCPSLPTPNRRILNTTNDNMLTRRLLQRLWRITTIRVWRRKSNSSTRPNIPLSISRPRGVRSPMLPLLSFNLSISLPTSHTTYMGTVRAQRHRRHRLHLISRPLLPRLTPRPLRLLLTLLVHQCLRMGA
jgi:hypothetical protein